MRRDLGLVAGVAAMALAGCVGGGGGGGGGAVGSVGGGGALRSFAQYEVAGTQLVGRLEQMENRDGTTRASALPAGTARYDGLAYVNQLAGPSLVDTTAGTLSLNADFNSGRITGTAGNFISDVSGPIGGTLAISADVRNVGGNAVMLGSASGRTCDRTVCGNVDLDISGQFIGRTGEGMYGEMLGTNRSVRGTTTLRGEFGAERR